MSTSIKFSNLYPGLSDQKHHIWKNHETQSLRNKTLKGEIEKKNQLSKKIKKKE
jgi:hypothetical protein